MNNEEVLSWMYENLLVISDVHMIENIYLQIIYETGAGRDYKLIPATIYPNIIDYYNLLKNLIELS